MKKLILTTVALLALSAPGMASTKADDYFQMGNIFATNKSYDQAIDAYMSAADADPTVYGVKAYVSIAIVLGQKKEIDQASKVIEQLIKDHSDSKDIYIAYKVLGKIREDQKRPAEAITAYETYLRLVPAERLKEKDRTQLEQTIARLRKAGG